MASSDSLVPILLLGGGAYVVYLMTRKPAADQARGLAELLTHQSQQPQYYAAPYQPAAPSGPSQPAPPASTPSSLTAPGAPAWQAFKDSGSGQVWVRNPATGEWRYISSPALYSKYGIAADEHNLAYGIPAAWGWPGADKAGQFAAT